MIEFEDEVGEFSTKVNSGYAGEHVVDNRPWEADIHRAKSALITHRTRFLKNELC